MEKSVYEFISKANNDPIVQRRTCASSGKEFAIFQSDVDFYNKISPTFAGKKFQIPLPTLCPEERQRRRFAWRNERKLYKRKCDASGKEIISMYAPTSGYKVFSQDIRWKDDWNPMDFGQQFDAHRSFGEQFDALLYAVPHCALVTINCENSLYANYAADSQNAYLSFGITRSEDILYSQFVYESKDICDGITVFNSHNCHALVSCNNCYDCLYSSYTKDSQNCAFVEYCDNCHHCIGCISLNQASYHIFNKQVSEKEFNEMWAKLSHTEHLQQFQKDFENFKKNQIVPYATIINSEKSYGDNLVNCKNSGFSYDLINSEDCRYVCNNPNAEMSMDIDYGAPTGTHFSYEMITCRGTAHSMFCFLCRDCTKVEYCIECHNCTDCFGCVGLRDKSYCFFNKQYDKETYEALVAQCIETMIQHKEWGEFLSPGVSVFGYNETIAQDYFPKNKKDVPSGRKWMDKTFDANIPASANVLKPSEIPGREWDALIADDKIINQIIICEQSGKPFRINTMELQFYRKHKLPLPRLHPDVRYYERFKQKHARVLYLRTCDKCGVQMVSIYPQNAEQKVYCEQCYNQAIYG